jgi:hypothetical protein
VLEFPVSLAALWLFLGAAAFVWTWAGERQRDRARAELLRQRDRVGPRVPSGGPSVPLG